MEQNKVKVSYDNKIVVYFMIAALFWAGAAFIVGLLAALQLAYWPLNFNMEWLTFSRIRPLHTNAAIIDHRP